MYSALDIVDAAILAKIPVLTFAKVYFLVGGKLQLGWFRELIRMQPINHNWEALARAVFRDDIDKQQRNLSLGIINYKIMSRKPIPIINNFQEKLRLFVEVSLELIM